MLLLDLFLSSKEFRLPCLVLIRAPWVFKNVYRFTLICDMQITFEASTFSLPFPVRQQQESGYCPTHFHGIFAAELLNAEVLVTILRRCNRSVQNFCLFFISLSFVGLQTMMFLSTNLASWAFWVNVDSFSIIFLMEIKVRNIYAEKNYLHLWRI